MGEVGRLPTSRNILDGLRKWFSAGSRRANRYYDPNYCSGEAYVIAIDSRVECRLWLLRRFAHLKSLEPQLVEKEVELNKLRQIRQGFAETGSVKRNGNTVDTVESYESLGLSHREAVNAARVESAVIDLTEAQRQLIECPAPGTQRC